MFKIILKQTVNFNKAMHSGCFLANYVLVPATYTISTWICNKAVSANTVSHLFFFLLIFANFSYTTFTT